MVSHIPTWRRSLLYKVSFALVFTLLDLLPSVCAQSAFRWGCRHSGTYVALTVYRDCLCIVADGFDTMVRGMVMHSNTVSVGKFQSQAQRAAK